MDVDVFRTVCSTCLSSDRNLMPLNKMPQVLQIFKLLMYDFERDHRSDIWTCWECLAMMRKIFKFKWKVHTAQGHLRSLALSHGLETVDRSYTLTSLAIENKFGYDNIFESTVYDNQIMDPLVIVKNEQCDILSCSVDVIEPKEEPVENSEAFVQNANTESTGALRTLFIEPIPSSSNAAECHKPRKGRTRESDILIWKQQSLIELVVDTVKLPNSTVNTSNDSVNTSNDSVNTSNNSVKLSNDTVTLSNDTVMFGKPSQDILKSSTSVGVKLEQRSEHKLGYTAEYMSDVEMITRREEAKKNVQYSSEFRCELCLMSFNTETLLETHLESLHTAKPGLQRCKICETFVKITALDSHTHQHHLKYTCKVCSHIEYNGFLMRVHIKSHRTPVVKRSRTKTTEKRVRKKIGPGSPYARLGHKTTVNGVEGYKCLECGMFFKKWSLRRTHFARFHSEGVQCDHCKKRFANKTSLIAHLRLHEGPPSREECPVCHKSVQTYHMKYHMSQHERGPFECSDCGVAFVSSQKYRAHLKYTRAHAALKLFSFPCPMENCGKGYPTKGLMQDHYNYAHLGKTPHKCTVCDKVYASAQGLRSHVSRVHDARTARTRDHVCHVCGIRFTDKKVLAQHIKIHSDKRTLSCDICHDTFKQKAALYTHRKRVHNMVPAKKQVDYFEDNTTT